MAGGVIRGAGTVLLLTGAFAVGGVIHRVVVEGSLAATSPVAVGGVAIGVVLILVGNRLEGDRPAPPSETDTGDEDTEGESAGEEDEAAGEFDERFSPVNEEDLEGRDRDDDRSRGG